MKAEDFIQSSATVRIYETKLLNSQFLARMAEAKDFEEAMKMLSETVYQGPLSRIDDPRNYGQALDEELTKTYETVREMNQGKHIYNFQTLRYSFHNLKVLVKEHILGEDFSGILSKLGTVDPTEVRAQLKSGSYNYDVEFMDYVKAVMDDYEKYNDPQRIDIMLDKFYLKEALKYAEKMNFKLFVEYAKDLTDVSNIKSILRAKNQHKDLEFVKGILVDTGRVDPEFLLTIYYEDIETILERLLTTSISSVIKDELDNYRMTGRLQAIEKALENHLMDRVKESKGITYGPEILFAYLQSKEAEIKNLRIILTSKLNGLSNEDIRERLRDGYV
ncbi:MAG: V-type ATP synthase subunit C [Tissierellia bacterium]|nr:V-type ATP synthase subunit C [Tissierellia bacterium]